MGTREKTKESVSEAKCTDLLTFSFCPSLRGPKFFLMKIQNVGLVTQKYVILSDLRVLT